MGGDSVWSTTGSVGVHWSIGIQRFSSDVARGGLSTIDPLVLARVAVLDPRGLFLA